MASGKAGFELELAATDGITPSLKNVESSIIRFVGAISAALAGIQVLAFPINAAKDFDRALRDVQKTTGVSDQDLAQMADRLVGVSKEVGNTAVALADIAAAAGQLGIRGEDNIIQFTESIARAAITLDLVEENAARAVAKILNVFNIEAAQTERVTSTINELTNTTAAQADELISVIQRVGSIAGLTFEQVAALGATAIESGLSPEVAGTSLVKFFSKLQAEAPKFATALGQDIGEFTSKSAFLQFQDFLNFVASQESQEQARLIDTLAGGGRVFAVFNKFVQDAASGQNRLEKNATTATAAFIAGTSAIDEYERVARALTERISIMGNNFTALAITAGNRLLPRLIELTDATAEFFRSDRAEDFARTFGDALLGVLDDIQSLYDAVQELNIPLAQLLQILRAIALIALANVFLGVTAALVKFTLSLGGLVPLFNGLVSLFSPLTSRLTKLTAKFGGMRVILNGLVAVLRANPIGLAVTAAVTAIGLLASRFESLGFIVDAISFSPFGRVIVGLASSLGVTVDKVKELGVEVLNLAGIQTAAQIAKAEEAANIARAAQRMAAQAATDFRDAIERESKRVKELDAGFEIKVTPVVETKDIMDSVRELLTDFQVFRAGVEASTSVLSQLGDKLGASTRASAALEENIERMQFAMAGAALEAEKLRQQQETSGGQINNQSRVASLEEEIRKTKELISIEQIRLVDQNTTSQIIEKETEEAIVSVRKMRERMQTASQDVVETFSAEGFQLFNMQLEERELRVSLKSIAKEIEGFRSETVDQGKGEVFFQKQQMRDEEKEVIQRLNKMEERIRAFRLSVSGPEQALIGEIVSGNEIDELKEIQVALEAARDASGEFAGNLSKAYQQSAADIFANKFILEGLVEAASQGTKTLQSLADVAKSVADNTLTEIRALQGELQKFSTDIDGILEDRRINIRFDRRDRVLTQELESVLSEQERITVEADERIANARNEGEKVYFRRQRDTALEALRSRETLLKQEQQRIEERNLKERLKITQQRATEFARLSQEAAQRGDLDEALGLKDAGKRSLQDAQKIIQDLAGMTTDVGGEIKAALSDTEISALVSELARVQGGITSAIPGINDALQQSTQEALAGANTHLKELSEELQTADAQVKLLTQGNADAEAAVKRLREAFDKTTAGVRLTTEVRRVRQGVENVDDQQNRIAPRAMAELRASLAQEFSSAVDKQIKAQEKFIKDQGAQFKDALQARFETPTRTDVSRQGRDIPQGVEIPGFDEFTLQVQALARRIVESNQADVPVGEGERLREGLERLRTVQADILKRLQDPESQQAGAPIAGGEANQNLRDLREVGERIRELTKALEKVETTEGVSPTRAGIVPVAADRFLQGGELAPDPIEVQATLVPADGSLERYNQVVQDFFQRNNILTDITGTGVAGIRQQLQQELQSRAVPVPVAPQVDTFEQREDPEGLRVRLNVKQEQLAIQLKELEATLPPMSANVEFVPAPTALEKLMQDIAKFFKDNGIIVGVTGAGDLYKKPPTNQASIPQFAAGGPIVGPGGPKSDSILGWLSNGEYVIDSLTRRFFGTSFFQGLQHMATSGTKLSMPRFATGGPVSRLPGDMTPLMGMAGVGGTPINLHLPGGSVVNMREGDTDIDEVVKIFRRESAKRGRRV